VNNVDLPGYLKNSKLLNNLSVQRLLQNWAIICSLAVIVLSLTAVITNDVISSKQDLIDQTAFTIETSVRNLDQILANFELRKNNILAAITSKQLNSYRDRSILEQGIQEQLSVLSAQTTDLKTAEPVIRNLEDNLRIFLAHDAALFLNIADNLLVKNQSSQNNINEIERLSGITSALNASSYEIEANLKRLSNITDEYVKMLVTDSRTISQINLFVVVTVSLIVIAIIAAGISLVIYRIDEPLSKVRVAMHDLSHGDMSRRLVESTVVHDEFSDLSLDFNRFAERTQSLFDEVTDAKDALEDSERRTRAILENALVGIAHLKDRRFISVNRKFEELFGYERHEIAGLHKSVLYPSEDDYKALNDAAYQLMANGDTYHGEWKMKHKDGKHFWCEVSAKAISENMVEDGTIWLFEDITQRKRSEAELRRLANFDTLTGLPNRALFNDRLEQGLERTKRQNGLMALIYIDLDRFKKINDSFGHTAGDELLIIISKLLCECVRGSDTVSRLGGDEFTIILPELQNISDAGKVAEKIIAMMYRPLSLKGQEIIMSPSIGISIYPDDAKNIEALLQNADSAMYHAKSKGRNNYQYYTQEMNAEARHRLDMESKLRRATVNDDFLLYYQPQVDVKSLVVTGYEALIRWHDKEYGMVHPNQFIPLLEDSGLIVSVGEWVLRKACSDIAQIRKKNSDFQSVSVNLSARQFMDNSLVDRIKMVLHETGVSPEHLVIEITETILMDETERSLQILKELSDLGLKLSMDDFGTGYSSLAYLKQFPIDVIKIDQSFVCDLHSNPSDAAICEAIIVIGRQLGLKVVAEGVETREQFNFMRDRSCHTIQGYFFGKPAPMEELVCNVNSKSLIMS